ncbi:MAG: anion permease [Oscillospiraceae bacterium]|nr:anion permease [Oscillospiraceae bacterium]
METEPIKALSSRLIFSLIFLALGIILALARPFGTLDAQGHIMLGTLIAAISTWMFRPAGGTMLIGAAILITGGLIAGFPIGELTTGFSSASIWLFIPAMFIGSSLRQTGLGKRIVLALFKQLNLTYIKILGGWLVVSILFALITPLATVRFLMLTPIAVSVADACCLDKGSRGRSLIVISCWILSIFPSLAWLNGSLFGPAFTSFLPAGPMRDMATPEAWSIVMAPWLLFSIVFVAALYFILKPEEELNITKDQLRQMYNELGPMSKKEKGCLVALVFTFACLVLQTFLPITANQVLLASLVIMLFLGVLSVGDISSSGSWDVIVFFGTMLSFTNIFYISGLTAWLTPYLANVIEVLAVSPLVFIMALFGICVILRFFDVAQGWIIASIFSLATPILYSEYGIHPLISTAVFVSASCLFFFRYAQAWIVQVEAVCGDGGWNPVHLRTASIVYLCVAVVQLLFSRFYWGLVGIL